jgi:hypothetical protein
MQWCLVYRHHCVGGTCNVFLQGTFPPPALKMGTTNYTVSHWRKSFMFETFAVWGCYAVFIGNYLPTYQYNLSVPSSYIFKGRCKNLIIFPIYLVITTNSVHNFFLNMFIAFLYMFQATVWPSSGEYITMQHLVFVTLVWSLNHTDSTFLKQMKVGLSWRNLRIAIH